ncbi:MULTISPECIES: hypothetical protein [unclassified Thiocapsa]|uniref:hypothetical protein n=1 Tax=unclassified Thiocapsa TaxID=2641286 RepID=UPI0035B398B0
MTTRLIETWLPIAEIGLEGLRERTPMTPFPAHRPLRVWCASRRLVTLGNRKDRCRIRIQTDPPARQHLAESTSCRT